MQVGYASPPLWIWLLIGGVFLGLPALAIGGALLLRAIRSRSATPASGAAREHARRSTRYGLIGLAAGVVAGIALLLGGIAAMAALACGGGYLCGLLVGEFAAQPRARGEQRTAVLRARRPGDYAPRWAAVTTAAVAALILGAAIAFAAAPPIRYGAWHPFAGLGLTLPGGATSWPGVPAMLAGLAFAAAVVLVGAAGLRRVAARPQRADGPERAADEWLRRQSGRAISGAVLSLLLLVLAAFLIGGSQGLSVPVPAISPAAYLGSRIMVVAGLGSACGSIVSWLLLSGWIRLPGPAAGPSATPALRPEA